MARGFAVLAVVLLALAATTVSAGRLTPQLIEASARSGGFHAETPLLRSQQDQLHRQGRSLLHAGQDHGSADEAAAHDASEPATATTDATGGTANNSGGRSYTWLKWVAAVVLLIEGLLGVLLPVLLKMTIHAGWLLTLVNCFAGAVFFAFGVLHLAPDALDAQSIIGLTRFPLAAFLVAVAFFAVFFLHRVLAPALRLQPHIHSNIHHMAPKAEAPKAAVVTVPAAIAGDIMPPAACKNCGSGCGNCGTDQCGCAGGVSAGTCGKGCQAGACTCAHKQSVESSTDSDSSQQQADHAASVSGFGATAATVVSAAAVPATKVTQAARPKAMVRAAALLPPVLILLGILCHTVLEGLAIGLQKSYGDVVTAFVAMASHKWVESVALAAAFLAAGSGMLTVIAFLIPFSLGPLVGIAIGVSVDNTNVWVVMVLFALVAGLFIYVGSVGIVAEEFARFEDPDFAATRPRGARFWMFGALIAGLTVVALLQLVPSGD